jgi:hypothetical protein
MGCAYRPFFPYTPSNMSAPLLKTIYWQSLFEGLYRETCRLYEQHNEQYKGAGRAYPYRVKPGTQKTGLNIIRLWCKHVATEMNKGRRIFTNAVPVNRNKLMQRADGEAASPSSVPGHLGKLAYCGLILGEEENPDQPFDDKVYRHRELDGGQGFGVRPIKAFHGTNRDFEVLISPELLKGVEKLLDRAGAKIVTVDSFGSQAETPTPQADPEPSKRQNLTHNKAMKGTIRNEAMTQAASAGADSGREDENQSKASADADSSREDGNAADGNGVKVSEPRGETQGDSGESCGRDVSEVARRRPGGRLSLNEMLQLAQNGDAVEIDAALLVEAYENKLVPAMGRAPYAHTAIQAGLESARRLVARAPEQHRDEFVNRMLQTINRMADYLSKPDIKYPFVREPGAWFDPDNLKSGILGAERRWLRKYEARAEELKDLKLMRAKRQAADDAAKIERAKASELYSISYHFQKFMMGIHPSNQTLRRADLDKWTHSLRLMITQDGYRLDEVKKVIRWLLDSPTANAKFWRKGTQGGGIRSIPGLRRNYKLIREQRAQDLAQDRQKKNKKHKTPQGKIKPMY